MKDGATLIYTSNKNEINIESFYEYILHRFFNLQLRYIYFYFKIISYQIKIFFIFKKYF